MMKLPGVSGDLGAKSAAQIRRAFPHNIKRIGEGNPNKLRKMTKCRLTNSDTQVIGSMSGPDTIGGVVGGKHDKSGYSGLRARKG